MKFQIRKCPDCKKYTLKDACPHCSSKTNTVHPAKFSPDDKYARYRIADKFKEESSSEI
ncbi:RNA-protein complex protein Nop10 [Candidatus Nitrosotenuis sp. DW1]|uniref:RNA-protein complex protein Nop10 n=1 Tax=Candidatus Nitrosotenuis sp. DW1 TaxID=2259672 RepID=UPI0015C7F723|nr:RNA-protein complex protein Nop10 [Candidatus Nitrosotenuis sp. DW1]QLH09760.1 RNA-protein complex protein Nop10 [Candidatus Nitrosotenuis sp. DW1]